MLLFGLKKCVFHTQMRQLSTLNIYSKNHRKTIGSRYWVELKCLNIRNPNFTVSKLFHTNHEDEKRIVVLPRLMWYPHILFSFSFIKITFSYCVVRFTIDKDFKLIEFISGAVQAVSVVSNALATQNYEKLDGMVKERALKILKRRIDLLKPEQRSLIAINTNTIICSPIAIRKLKTKAENEAIIEITVSGLYPRHDSINIMNPTELRTLRRALLTYVYVFQRKYVNGVGGSWIVKIVNHESLNI